MTAAVEVRSKARRSAFHFGNNEGFLRDSDEGRKDEAQFARHAAEILLCQHRVFAFLVYVCKTKARLARWDRTGCIVSTPIDLEKEPSKLLRFVYRLGLMSPKELGYDTTAVLATPAEVQRLNSIHHVNRYAFDRADEILRPETRIFHPIYKIARDNVDDDPKGGREYFVGKHSFASDSVTGRATKGYIVFILADDGKSRSRLGFLKDFWRPLSNKVASELKIYGELRNAGVRHVATVIGGGDIEEGTQLTRTDDYLERPHARSKRAHSYIIFEDLARPLKDYEDSKGMITIVYHALIGHKDAWEKAGILHRDISVNNIMFVVDQNEETTTELYGILNDWDICIRKSDLAMERTQNGRPGTWAFMSGGSLRWPFKPYQLSDDIEAFVHVVTFCCLRFHWHSRTAIPLCNHNDNGTVPDEKELYGINGRNTKLGSYMASYYDACDPGHLNGIGIDTGGERKTVLAKFGTFDWSFLEGLAPQPLILLVAELCGLLQMRYGELDFVELHNKYSGRRRIVRIPRPRRAANSHSPSSDGPSGATQRAEEGTAPATDVSNRACKNGALDCHSRIKAIFEEAIDAFRVPGASFQDKTPDQFLGLREYHCVTPRSPSGSRPITTTCTTNSQETIETISGQSHQDTESSPTRTTGKRRRSNTQADVIAAHAQLSKRLRMSGRQSVEKLSQTSEDASSADTNDETETETETEEEYEEI